MQFDGFTFVAQIINFVILLLLLQLFLYGPVVRAMEERQARIAANWDEAEKERDQATEEAEQYQQKRQELEEERDEILAQAQDEAEAQRQELYEDARQDVEEAQRRWEKAVQRDKESFMRSLRQRVTRETDKVVRRALRELADVDLEEKVVACFIGRLRELEEKRRETIAESIRQSDQKVLVRSGFYLPDEIRHRLTDAVREHVLDGEHLEADFERSPDLICGVELQTNGRRIAWTVKQYLDTLEEQVVQALERTEQQAEREQDG